MAPPIRILLIDDDDDDALIFNEALQDLAVPFQCIHEKDGIAAIEALKQNTAGNQWNYIFLDLNMPKLNGLECLKQIRAMRNCDHIPVIIYTTSASTMEIRESETLGGSYFLTKSPTIHDLASDLQKIFRMEAKRSGLTCV